MQGTQPPVSALPDDFCPSELDEGFLNQIGPLFQRRTGNGHYVIAFRATEAHLNRFAAVHGGMLASLADVAIGMNLARVSGVVESAVTVSLSVDYIGAARAGEWIEAHCALRKHGGRLRFGDCDVCADGRLVARGHATFYLPRKGA